MNTQSNVKLTEAEAEIEADKRLVDWLFGIEQEQEQEQVAKEQTIIEQVTTEQTSKGELESNAGLTIESFSKFLNENELISKLVKETLESILIQSPKEELTIEDRTKQQIIERACRIGNLEIVKLLHKQGVSITFDNELCLRQASRFGHLEVVKFLVENGANINIKHERDNSLFCAISNGHLEVVKFLIENGADYANNNGRMAICTAIQGGFIEIVKYLLEKGFDKRDSFEQVCYNNTTRPNHFLILNFLMNQLDDKEYYNKGLQAACTYSDCIETIKILIKNGADVTSDDNKAIKITSRNKNCLEVVKLLIRHGAQISPECIENAADNVKQYLLEITKPLYYGIQSKSQLNIKLPNLEEIIKDNIYYYVFNSKYENGGHTIPDQNNKYSILSQFGQVQIFKDI